MTAVALTDDQLRQVINGVLEVLGGIHFRREAMRRDISVPRLIHDLLDVIALTGLLPLS
jgi:hypothetical protein